MHDCKFIEICVATTQNGLLGLVFRAVHMSRASPGNRADSILSPLIGA